MSDAIEYASGFVAGRASRDAEVNTCGSGAGCLQKEAQIDALTEQVEALRADAGCLHICLAASWFYGDWKAETANEREMEKLLTKAGWWPISSETELIAAITAARAAQEDV